MRRTAARRGRQRLGAPLAAMIGLLAACSPAAADPSDVAARIKSAFDLTGQNVAEPPEALILRALARGAKAGGDSVGTLAYISIEQRTSPDPTTGIFAGTNAISIARLPRPRPDAPIITGSIPPSNDFTSTDAGLADVVASEAEFYGRFAGSFSGSGEVKRNARAGANKVTCTLTGTSLANGVSISGECGASIFSRKVSADIRLDPTSGAYTGTYIGASGGAAKLWGQRDGDTVELVITWPKPVNGDTKATMTIRNTGNGSLAIIVTDAAHPGGPTTEVTRLALSRSAERSAAAEPQPQRAEQTWQTPNRYSGRSANR